MSPLRVFLAVSATGAAVAVAVAAALQVGALGMSEQAVRDAERQTPARQVRAELPRAGVGAAGWSWVGGVPGFKGEPEERFWNGFVLSDSLRARLSASARVGQLAEGEVQVLRALRLPGSRKVLAIAAAGSRDGATCLTAIGDGLTVRFECMRQASQAAKASALVAVAIDRPDHAVRSGWRLYLLGVARGDVKRIRFVTDGGETWHLYSRDRKYLWGTFTLGVELPHPWSGRLLVERVRGARDAVELTSARQGTASFLVTPPLGSG